jgi:hypothetical protein
MGRGRRRRQRYRQQQNNQGQQQAKPQARRWFDSTVFDVTASPDPTPEGCFLTRKCRGRLITWSSPQGALTMKVCEGHAGRMALLEHGFREVTSEPQVLQDSASASG